LGAKLPHVFGAAHALLGSVGMGGLTAVVVVETRSRVNMGVVVVTMVEMVVPVTVTGWVTVSVRIVVLHGGCVSMHEHAVLAIEAAAEASSESSKEAGSPVALDDVLLVGLDGVVVGGLEVVLAAFRF
jgi:hypothetical protein